MKYVSLQEYRKELEKLESTICKFRNNGSGCWSYLSPFINSNNLFNNEPIDIQISWCGCGAVPTKKASQFIQELAQATELAKNFKYNGYRIKFKDSKNNK